MKQTPYFFSLCLIMLWSMIVMTSCVDLDYDSPGPNGQDPNIPTNATIADIKALHQPGQYVEITDDLVFDALVISNDESGNIFKQLVVSDETGGIEIRIDIADLQNIYPQGRKVYVKAKGLWISDYNDLIQLGAGQGVDNNGDPELIRIPESIAANFIIPATYGNPVVPTIKSFSQLTVADVSTLIQLDGWQFINADAGVPYADSAQNTNREIEDCGHNRIIMRNSGFSDFWKELTPTGNGTVVGILGIYRGDFQFAINDNEDVNFIGDRCGGGSGGSITAAALRQAFESGTTTSPNGTLQGVVISDRTSGSVHGLSVYIQDATGGIVLRYTDDHTFALGDEIAVDVSGATMSEFRGLLQVNELDPGNTIRVGHPGDVTPRSATIAEVLANAEDWESTLVIISNVTLSGNSTYSGSITATDPSGAMVLFTQFAATFANTPIPSGPVTLTAIISEFDAPQLIIRNTNDVNGGSTGGDDITAASLRQAFHDGNTNISQGILKGIVISDYTTASVHGLSMYIQDSTGGIVIRFTDDHSFELGDEVSINVAGGDMSEFNGLLQVNGISPTDGTVLSHPGDVTPRVTTISQILANAEAWESTLVKLTNVTLSGTTTFSGAVTVTDATGSIIMFTRSASTFANVALPSGTVDIIAIVSQFTDTQLIIRSPADVQ